MAPLSGRSLLVRYNTTSTYNPVDGASPMPASLSARLFDAATGQPLAPEIGATNHAVYWARFSPDGKQLATITLHAQADYRGDDGWRLPGEIVLENPRHPEKTTAHLRDAWTGAVLATLPFDDIARLEFNPLGGTFVTTHWDGTARVWDLATRQPIKTFKAGGPFVRLRWSTDGRQLLAAEDDKPARLLSPTGEDVSPPAPQAAPAWPPGPGRMAVLRRADGITLWHPYSGSHLRPPRALRHGDGINVWHPLLGDHPSLQAPLKCIACPDVADFGQIGPDGRTLLTQRHGSRLVLLWDAAVRPCDRDTQGRDPPPSRYEVLTSSLGGMEQISLLDWNQDLERVGEPLLFGKGQADAVLSSDEKRLFVLRERAAGHWELRGYDVPALAECFPPISLGTIRADFPLEYSNMIHESGTGLLALVCSPTEKTSEVRLFRDGKHLGTAPLSGHLSQALLFSADGSTLVAIEDTPNGGETIYAAWSLPDLRPRFDPLRMAGGRDCTISPDGRYLVDTARGQIIDLTRGATIGGLPAGVRPRSFLPDGRLLADTASGPRLVDFQTGKPFTLPMNDLHSSEVVIGPRHVLLGWESNNRLLPVAYDALTGEAITVPAAVGVSQRKHFPVETRSIEQLRLLAGVLSGRRLDPIGAIVPLEPDEYLAAWHKLRTEMPEACRLTDDEEVDWHRDEIAVAESWQDWNAAETHHRWFVAHAPEDGEARRGLANVLAEQGRWAEARRECEAAVGRRVNPFPARVDAAWIALVSGDREQHRRDVASLLHDYEKTASTIRAAALLHLAALGNDGDAARRALAIVRRQGSLPAFGQELAWAALAECRAGRPRELLDALRADQRNSPEVLDLLLRAAVFKQAGEAREAAAALERLTGREPLNGWREREIARLLRQEMK